MQLVEGEYTQEVTREQLRSVIYQRFMSPFFTGAVALMCSPGKIQLILNQQTRMWHIIVMPNIRRLENMYVSTFEYGDKEGCIATFLEVAYKAFDTGKISL